MSSVMDIVAELLSESSEIRTDSQFICKTETKVSKGFSQESQDSQPKLVKKQIAKGYGCAGCGCKTYELIANGWQCENCKAFFEIIGGTKGPILIN